MRHEEPSWWYAGQNDPRSGLLAPVASVWAAVANYRMAAAARHRSSLPVICVGNFTAGGTGKTPLSLSIAERLIARGLSPAFLTRGYRAEMTGWVDSNRQTAREAGDEPLLLARSAPVLISPDRAAGALMIEARRPAIDVIVMDDGLQNPALAKDLRIALVDGRRGVGNGRVMPAGPLRASLDKQLDLVDAIVINEPPTGSVAGTEMSQKLARWLRGRFGGPVLTAHVAASADVSAFRARPVLAFAGIANPQRFYDLLTALGVEVVETRSFGDHHAFSEVEARALMSRAEALGASLVTTEKDHVRFSGRDGALRELGGRCGVLPIRLAFNDRDGQCLNDLLDAATAKRGTSTRASDRGP